MADEFSKTKAPVAVLEYEPSSFERALLKHKSKFILVAVLGVAGSLGYWGYRLYKDATEKTAAVAFVRATSTDELRKVASEYAGKPAAGSALIFAAQQVAADKPAEAAALLKEYLDKYPEHPLRSTAMYRRAEYLTAAGDKAAAEKEYEAVAAGDSPEAGFALLRLGDFQWGAGNVEKAKEYYARLTGSGPFTGSPAREQAKQREQDLKSKAPDLVEYVEEKVTPPPPPPPPTDVEPDNAASPGDGLLPPPLIKPRQAAPPPAPAPGITPVPVPVPAPVENNGTPDKPAQPAGTPPPAGEGAAPAEKTPAEGAAPATPETPADGVDKKSSENSKPKLDGAKKPATKSPRPNQ